jgi:MFS family permease
VNSRSPIRLVRDAAASIKGNARACVFLEPMFVIPHAMYSGFLTLYMVELGLTLSQVGMITSLGLAVQFVFSALSTYITDTLGRKRTSLIFDIAGWSAAQLIWAAALGIHFFLAAAVIHASFRVVANSWHCLMLEDSQPADRIHIFNFLQMSGILGGFFAPFGALLINRMTLVPAMRVMLAISVVSMTLMFVIRHFIVTETAVGRQKMEDMKAVRMRDVFASYVPVLKRMLSDRLFVTVLSLRALNFVQMMIRTTFLAVLITGRLGFPAEAMAVFHTVSAAVMLLLLLCIAPMLSRVTRYWPLSMGIGFHAAAVAVLLLSPPRPHYALLVAAAVFAALGTSVTTPRIEALTANTIINEERSTANAVMAVITLILTTPFGYISGLLAEIDVRLPFVLILAVFLICLLLLYGADRMNKRRGNG